MSPTSGEDPVAQLSDALTRSHAKLRINRARLVPSTLHDATYHVAMIACAMRVHGGPGKTKRVLAAWLKLLQFVAARPSLVDNLLEYARSRRDGDLEKWSLMPRGYLGDRTHDSVVDFLVAAGRLRRDGDHVEAAARFDVLEGIATKIEATRMFERERTILMQLREIRPTKVLLGGA
jgi:hypothetical protein